MGIRTVDATMKNSPCYKAGKKIALNSTEGGIYLHSIGCPCEKAQNIINNENKSGARAAVQAVIQHDGQVLEGLPVYPAAKKAMRNWHAGSGKKGSANNTHIGVEMCEPETIKYTSGSAWVELADGSNTKKVVLENYKHAVEYFALRCKQFGLDPLKDGVILSHSEGHKRGYASNHSDVEHIWKKFGLTMDQFRKDVKAKMDGGAISVTGTVTATDTSGQKVTEMYGYLTVIYTGADGINVRKTPSFGGNVAMVAYKGAEFDIVGISADEKWYKTKEGYFITAVPDYVKFKATEEQKASTAGTGYYRVRRAWDKPGTQIAACKKLKNAIEICKQNSGYYVYDNDGNQVYPEAGTGGKVPYNVRVNISDLRIRKGAGTTFDYWKDNGKARHTGKGEFTIVAEKDGPGASRWGLLKAYKAGRNGWISLDHCKKVD